MKLLLILALAAVAYAAPDKRPSYRAPPPPPAYPQRQPAYSAPKPAPYPAPAPAYVAAPQEPQYNYAPAPSSYRQPKEVIPILSQTNERDDYGYKYSYETGDYQTKQETGKIIPGSKKGPYGEDEDGSLQVDGQFYYQSPEGIPITLTYRADENGFQPQGAHLPTPPPLPEALVQAIRDHEAAKAAAPRDNYQQQSYEQPAASYQRPAYQARPAAYPAPRPQY